MPLVTVVFLDGEVLHAAVPEVTLDQAVLEAEVRGVPGNNGRALLPLSAIRLLWLDEDQPAPAEQAREGWDRAVFHFVDGQALRAWIAPDARLGRYGGVWRAVEPDDDTLRTVAVPYSALKAVFEVRSWDSRPAAERAAGDLAGLQLERLSTLLTQADRPATGGGLLERMRGAGAG